jgi:hypothetical protein
MHSYGKEVGRCHSEEVGSAGVAGEAVGAEGTLIPSAASIPGYHEGGGQHLIPVGMRQAALIWVMVTHTAQREHSITRGIDGDRRLLTKRKLEE